MIVSAGKPFPMRILYAPTPDLIKAAADAGYNYVVVHSFGHVRRTEKGRPLESVGTERSLEDDLPIFFERYPEIARERHDVGEEAIRRVQKRIGEKIALASSLGLKSLATSYELSLPYELERCYPELYPGRGLFCLAAEKRRRFLEDKIAEIFETFPDLNGYIYTAKEAREGIYYSHQCEHCHDLSVAQRLNLLAETVRAGKDRVKPEAELIFRAWGTHFPGYFYRERGRIMWEWFGKPEELRERYAGERQNDVFDPETVLPEFARLSDPSIIVCCKASWQDFDFHQPPNPWVGRFEGHQEIVEVSYEYFHSPTRKYFALTGQMDRFIKYAAQRGVQGVMALPCAFGFSEAWDDARQSFITVPGKGHREMRLPDAHEKCIGNLTPYLISRLAQNPGRTAREVVTEYVSRELRDVDTAFVTDLLLSQEDFVHNAVLCDGLALAALNHYMNNNNLQLEFFKDHASWSCCTFEEGEDKILAQLRALPPLFAKKEEAVIEAERRLKKLEDQRSRMDSGAYDLLYKAYAGFVDLLKLHVLSQKISLTLWAIERGDVENNERSVNFVLNCMREKEKLLLQSPIRKDLAQGSRDDRLGGLAGNQRYKTPATG